MKKVVLFLALAVGLLTSASTMQAQNDNYITLKVKKDSVIKLQFKAAAENTSIQLSIGGGISPTVLVGTSWTNYSFTAHSSTIKIYNALTGLGCSNNKGNITGIDLSQSKQLVTLYCGLNNLTTDALDAMYCSLPIRQASDNAVIYPIYQSTSPDNATVIASNAQNATSKNWKVQYVQNNSDIPTTGTYTCPQLNMNSYITLTVKNSMGIDLDFWGAANATPIRIVNGSETEDIIVGTRWEGTKHFTTDGTTMTIYGDLKRFDCAGNGANITALDVSNSPGLETLLCQGNQISRLGVSSNNTSLSRLICFGNNLTTSAIDDIYCSLPDRTGNTNGVIEPVYDPSYSDNATVFATNAQNAIAKNWKVQYSDGNADIPTTGTYVCPQLNMSRYITLTVKNGEAIKLHFKAAAAGTPVRIVSGSNTQNITVGTNWTGTATYTAGSTTMTIYGDLTGFGCSQNGENLTALDASKNTLLKELYCKSNYITDLYVSKNTNLEALNCSFNKFSSLNVSGCTQLTELICYHNKNLSTLNVSGCSQLRRLYCYDSNLSTQALDDIYCALPDRTGNTNGVIDPVYDSSSSNHATVLATNKQNAIAKNWKVRYSSGSADIPATTGTYTCPQLNMSRYITLTVTNGAAIELNFMAATAGTPVRIVSGSNTQDVTVDRIWMGYRKYTAGSTTMTVYGDITGFACSGNGANLNALDVSKNTQLKELYCNNNNLSSLDVSKNTKLTVLSCSNNKLSNLDISKNTQLKQLICHGNNLSTQVLDDIYCALPDRTGNANGKIQPVFNSSSSDLATVLATNKQNAIAKNWKVQYYDGNADIPATSGKHKCSATDIAEATAEPALTLYPNPVADVLYLSATARTIRVYDIYGTEVAHATDTDRVEVSHLPAGIYTVKADGTVAKMVKR